MDSSKTPAQQENKLHFLDYWRIIRIRKTVILAVFLLVVITATVVTYVLPASYSSTAKIKVERDSSDIPGFSDAQTSGQRVYDPYFIQTEFEVLQSEVILKKVIEALKLNERWGKKYQSGTPLKLPETMELLRKAMNLTPVRNASIIEIEVFSDTPEEAAEIANKIAEVYKQHRLDVNLALINTGIKALEDRKKEHDATVEAQQKEVDRLRTDLKISEVDPMSQSPTPTLTVEALTLLQQQQITAHDLQVFQETQLTELMKLLNRDPAKLREAIQTASRAA